MSLMSNFDYLSIISTSVVEIFNEMNFNSVFVHNEKKDVSVHEVMASVGFTGQLKGFLLLSGSVQTAQHLITEMLRKMEITIEEKEFGQFHRESFGEVVNQITGRIAMKFASHDINCNITPPTIIMGRNITSSISEPDISFYHSLNFSFGLFGIFTGLKKT